MVNTLGIHNTIVQKLYTTSPRHTYVCMRPLFIGPMYTFSHFIFTIILYLNKYSFVYITCSICIIIMLTYLSSRFSIKDNTLTIIIKISPFGFDGNHFRVLSPPPVNTCKHIYKNTKLSTKILSQNNKLLLKNSSPNTKLLSPFDIKGKLLANDE